MKPQKSQKRLRLEEQKTLLTGFLKQFQDSKVFYGQDYQSRYGFKKYLIEIQRIANLQSNTLQILIQDLEQYFRKDQQAQMVKGFRYNTLRYIKVFEEIVSELMPERTKELNPEQEIQTKYTSFLKKTRIANYNTSKVQLRTQNQYLPFQLHQNFDVSIVYGPNSKVSVQTISQIKAQNIGQLITTKAIVVRATEVRPELVVGTYACDICNSENYTVVYDTNFKPMAECRSKKCIQAMTSGKLTFLPNHSKFRSFQQLKIQQTPDQLLRGAIPKATHLELRGHMINAAQPGDIIKVQGIVLPKQRAKSSYYKDLFFDSYIYVTKVIREKKKYVDLNITEEMRRTVIETKQSMNDEQFFDNLAQSIAPQIYGMKNVKKALLLQMAGGVTTQTEDHLRIRGQINIALFGDPGIAKSQLLKHISYVSPRAVYTTGKGSSGVGLTAAIVTDPVTKELSLEAGALVLADMGVCCIDEFDKMDEYDRTAIHEVMEQQTVSITKAGIITTLNARTAVLAAANPLYGRYNKKESTQKNLNLPAALLSRFDLIFILLDTQDKQKDYELALHIGKVHQKKKVPVNGVFDEQFLKTYIAMCKQYEPTIPEQLNDEMIRRYIEKRQLQMDASRQGESYTTMRSLLALIRLSQARAKLRFSNQVSNSDVLQSIEIIEQSQKSVQIQQTNKIKSDTVSNIFDLIKNLCNYSKDKRVEIQKLKSRGICRGFSSNDIQITLKNYQILNVINNDGRYISLITS